MNRPAFLLFLISLAGSIALIVSESKSIYDKRRKWYNRVTKKGWIILICATMLIVLPIIQKHFQDKEDDYLRIVNKKAQENRDSIMQERYNSSLINSVTEIKRKFDTGNTEQTVVLAKTLGEYGLRLDTVNKRIVRIVKDSLRTKVEIPNPILSLAEADGHPAIFVTKVEKPTYTFALQSVSADASSTNFDINTYILFTNSQNGQMTYGGSFRYLQNTDMLPQNGGKILYKNIIVQEEIGVVLFLLKGLYSNTDKSKIFPIEDVYYYNIKTQRSGLMGEDTKKEIFTFLNTKKINF